MKSLIPLNYLIIGFLLWGCSSNNNETLKYIQPNNIITIADITASKHSVGTTTKVSTKTLSLTSILLSETTTYTPEKQTAIKDRFYDSDGTTNYSYIPPLGWSNIPPGNGQSLHMWVFFDENGLQLGDYACSLYFIIYYPGNISAKEFSNRELINNQGLDTQVDSAGKFITYAGIDAYKVVLFRTFTNGNTSENYYIFHKEDAIIFIQYKRSYGLNIEQDVIVDNSMKTILFD
jgi:uncharacterized protein YcfL